MIFLLEEKTCRAEVFCTEQQHSMAEAGGEKFPLVFAFVGEYTQKLHDSLKEAVMPQIEAGKVRPFVLALYGPIEWDADYSPWYATALQGREFAGNAPQYLDFIQYRLLPYLKESFPLSGEVYTLGYSLGGLAALYYYFELGFAGCISCSGSLWYPGFQDYCREQIEKKLCISVLAARKRIQQIHQCAISKKIPDGHMKHFRKWRRLLLSMNPADIYARWSADWHMG